VVAVLQAFSVDLEITWDLGHGPQADQGIKAELGIFVVQIFEINLGDFFFLGLKWPQVKQDGPLLLYGAMVKSVQEEA